MAANRVIDISELDLNFSKEIIKAGGENIHLCFQCGTCTGSCPSGRQSNYRIRKLIRKACLGMKEEVLSNKDIWLCTTCYVCYDRCPRKVNPTDVIYALRNIAIREGYMLEPHKKVASYLLKTGHMVPLVDKIKDMRGNLGLEEIPPSTYKTEKALNEVKSLLKLTGFDKIVGG